MTNIPHVHGYPSGQLIRFVTRTIEDGILNDADTFSEKYVNSLVVKAPLPENIGISVQNEVNQLYSVFQVKSDILQFLGGGIGKNFDRGYSQREYWRGPENSDMSVELHFNAYTSGYVDVMKPTQNLLLMAASRETSIQGGEEGAVIAGLDEIWTAPSKTIVIFGDYFYHNNMIIKSVEVSYSNNLDRDFNPMSAVANVTMIPTDPMGFAVMYGGSRYGGMTFNTTEDAINDYNTYAGDPDLKYFRDLRIGG